MTGSDFRGMFDGLAAIFAFLVIVCVPLSIWKLIDIIIWIWNHVHISLT